MSDYKEKVLDEFCSNCGTRLKQYPENNGETAIKSCPNEWRSGEKFEDCKEVVEVIE